MADARIIEFFFDIGSAYSYLAATQVEALATRTGASVRWRPFLLGGVFKSTGNDMPARLPAKARWLVTDMNRWTKVYGVPWELPPTFPPNTVKTQRALVVVAERSPDRLRDFALALFRAYWAEKRDVSSADAIRDVANEIGLDGPAIVAATDEQVIKDRLREWTDEAVLRGAFGAPTFFVGDEIFWGNDRMDHIERLLRPR